jgi:hypothetical protein
VTVAARLRDGRTVDVSAKYGETVSSLVARLTESTLTGSAAMLDNALVETADGGTFRFADATAFTQKP